MNNRKAFLRTLFLSGIIFSCFTILIIGISIAYENIRQVLHAEFVEAVEVTEEGIRILDFYIK